MTKGWVFVVLKGRDAREGDLKIFVKQSFIPSKKIIERGAWNRRCFGLFSKNTDVDAREDIKTDHWVFQHFGDKRVGFRGPKILKDRTADNGIPEYHNGR
jgi:hypothetical protein